SSSMQQDCRRDLIKHILFEAQSSAIGNNLIESYKEEFRYIDENQILTEKEKALAKKIISFNKDVENLLFEKVQKYKHEGCGRFGFTTLFCEHCARDCLINDFKNWTSGNSIVDRAIQNAQINCPIPRRVIEWVPYSDLYDIKFKTRGGFASIYTATWKKGYILSFDNDQQCFKRYGAENVILKRLKNPNADEEFLNELYSSGFRVVALGGISKDPKTGDYFLVLDQYERDLSQFIRNKYTSLKWMNVYNLFWDISTALYRIHLSNLVHRDLHPGNVLQKFDGSWRISDLVPESYLRLMCNCWKSNPEDRPNILHIVEYFYAKIKETMNNSNDVLVAIQNPPFNDSIVKSQLHEFKKFIIPGDTTQAHSTEQEIIRLIEFDKHSEEYVFISSKLHYPNNEIAGLSYKSLQDDLKL
ncbi:25342_t:CDS:2, partial [Racocetra persica]